MEESELTQARAAIAESERRIGMVANNLWGKALDVTAENTVLKRIVYAVAAQDFENDLLLTKSHDIDLAKESERIAAGWGLAANLAEANPSSPTNWRVQSE